ncbi:ribosome biogenesis GTP-binding protein YihA/YsxC [Lacticaseibacillus manihotivorans]|jgi:GTP-binding protein|uniref:Probable GTP-binding protein EngB n=2 Tax=Lacticaseibacillus manihotivorans TaxID=88233 RepID=A0A0R1QL73_9LACO|nr:ribosome biogenesis GTP-binding protein YihA/YsxC [Lacticaseibacillus manihotivorans]KRL45273.1 ribosome biogenesis GTP-binding protein YsxC [Lacticaseibacillus manihotivorans DSM 13343 = JCM 12514]QFQ91530.1 YihA family ribosome biogenesis GTP-binding protein [Lacticaseibacillus manihotivorans]
MKIHNVDLTISAVSAKQYPDTGFPEIAFVGRSNVGKSSLINRLIDRKAMARTSSVPGKTQTLNFYILEDMLYFVDVPGYGFAKVSKADRAKFAAMIEEYLTTRKQLHGAVLLVDARHEPSEDDVSMYQYLKYFHIKTLVVGTKVDKTSRAKRNQVIRTIKQTLDLNQTDDLILFSAETGEGKPQVWKWLEQTAGIEEAD